MVDTTLTKASGTAEWVAALAMLEAAPGDGRKTVGGDRGYDNNGFVAGCREQGITPHVAQWPTTKRRKSAIDQRTTRHPGYRMSIRKRKRIEETFGWLKTVACTRTLRFIGVVRNSYGCTWHSPPTTCSGWRGSTSNAPSHSGHPPSNCVQRTGGRRRINEADASEPRLVRTTPILQHPASVQSPPVTNHQSPIAKIQHLTSTLCYYRDGGARMESG